MEQQTPRTHVVFDSRGEIVEYELERERGARLADEARSGLKAVALAPSLELCRALLRGEAVPRELLDQKWLERYGIRH